MGSHPDDIAAGAKILVELGYDVVDVNLACPGEKDQEEVPRRAPAERAR